MTILTEHNKKTLGKGKKRKRNKKSTGFRPDSPISSILEYGTKLMSGLIAQNQREHLIGHFPMTTSSENPRDCKRICCGSSNNFPGRYSQGYSSVTQEPGSLSSWLLSQYQPPINLGNEQKESRTFGTDIFESPPLITGFLPPITGPKSTTNVEVEGFLSMPSPWEYRAVEPTREARYPDQYSSFNIPMGLLGPSAETAREARYPDQYSSFGIPMGPLPSTSGPSVETAPEARYPHQYSSFGIPMGLVNWPSGPSVETERKARYLDQYSSFNILMDLHRPSGTSVDDRQANESG